MTFKGISATRMVLLSAVLFMGCNRNEGPWIVVKDVNVSANGKLFVIASNELTDDGHLGKAIVYDSTTGKEVGSFGRFNDWLSAVGISSDGKIVVAGSYRDGITVWNTENGEKRKGFGKTRGRVLSVSLSPDGETIASGEWDSGGVTLWNVADGTAKKTFQVSSDGVDAVRYSPNGKLLATSGGGVTTIWSTEDMVKVKTLSDHSPFQTTGLAFSPDNKLMATSGGDGYVRVWELSNYKVISKLNLDLISFDSRINSVSFVPNSTSLICGGENKQLFIWKYDQKNSVFKIAGHENAVYSVAVSRDGKRFFTASHDQTAKVWDLLDRKCVFTIKPEAESKREK